MDILQHLQQMALERDIPLDELLHELEEALAQSYKKFVGATGEVTVRIDAKHGWTAQLEKEVVGVVTEPSFQMSLTEARKRKSDAEIGDFIPV
ncbi:MAG: transcription termination/antitermination protein NusA, partial [Fimbriimonadaceae bacterium]|nr:transcription termination/antitermination protein NusA [Fimbriimonadaceae bacterium]